MRTPSVCPAAAIARQVGILSRPTLEDLARDAGCSVADVSADRRAEVQAAVVTGAEIDRFTQSDWDRVCAMKELVFARTTPVQKLQIVQAFQARGEVVAATGDGVNDRSITRTRAHGEQSRPARTYLSVPLLIRLHCLSSFVCLFSFSCFSPALKAADLGVAMGISGRSVHATLGTQLALVFASPPQ